MGEAAKAGDDIPVAAGEVGGAWVAEPLEQRQCRLLHPQVFLVHQRHQSELPPRLLGLRLQPAALHRLQAQRQGPGIAREGHGGVAPDLPRELGLNAGHFVLQGLVLIGVGSYFHLGVDARAAHGVHRLMAGLDRGEHRLPLTFDRRAVGVQLDLEAGLGEHCFAFLDSYRPRVL